VVTEPHKTPTGVRTDPNHKVVELMAKIRVKGIDKGALNGLNAAPIHNNVGTITPVHQKRKALILSHPKETIRGRVRIIRTTPITRTIEVGEETTTIIIPEVTIQVDARIHGHLSHLVAHKTSKVVVTKAITTPIPPAITMVVEIQRVEAKGTTTTGEIKIGINAAGRGNPVWLPLHQGAPHISMEHGNGK